MSTVATFNGTTKRIHLVVTGQVSVRDIISDADRWIHDNQQYHYPFNVSGYDIQNQATGVISTLYARLVNGWRVEASGNTEIIDGVLMVDGGADSPFVTTPGQTLVQYSQPIKTETVSLGGATGASPSQIADAVWNNVYGVEVINVLRLLKDIEAGNWQIINNQMIFVGVDGITEVARFDLRDSAGSPSMESVYRRVRV